MMVKVELKGMWLNDDFKNVEPITLIVEVANRKIISADLVPISDNERKKWKLKHKKVD